VVYLKEMSMGLPHRLLLCKGEKHFNDKNEATNSDSNDVYEEDSL